MKKTNLIAVVLKWIAKGWALLESIDNCYWTDRSQLVLFLLKLNQIMEEDKSC